MSENEFKELSLTNFAKGAAVELFDRELYEVLKNIDDPNTKKDMAREITLKFTIKPDESQEEAMLAVEAKSKLAPVRMAKGQAFFGKRKGKGLVAYSHNINQLELKDQNNLEVIDGAKDAR